MKTSLFEGKDRTCPITIIISKGAKEVLKQKAASSKLSQSDIVEALIRNAASLPKSIEIKNRNCQTSVCLTEISQKRLDELCKESLSSRNNIVQFLIERLMS